ncbi:MAG: PLDc N-terminal domain-containing protein [Proteobacteria bacterium]|nr:PLDc N-terminal domain-containing protein [Pseudomonadota bacterium]MBU1585123.1 PLDc N-terminal domain-containing protein [Pseudomonadota bacterium]MBU2453824.1 PLDc N-terminal domain-containing protein [Pseudomonadota bacterium]MBU2630058.1 PLDc N-terminal domain-containing protein [Pseudomonadota bacterium]
MDQTILYLLIIFAISFGLTMLALIDIILKDFGSIKTKIIWHFVAIVPIVGWLIYLLFGYRKGQRKKPA